MAPDFETGTSSFLDRQSLARRFEENLEHFLEDLNFEVMPYGHPVVLQDSTWIRSKLKRVESKENLAAVRVKFTPDYIITHKKIKDILFYADAKASITPVFFSSQIDRIKHHYGEDSNLSRNDIGEIEREAWYTYNKSFPPKSVALIIATPYHPRLLLAEWVENIECMWCLKEAQPGNPIPWDCKSCPVFNQKGGFGVLVNEFAGGSGTPHTNIHLGSLRTLDVFLKEEFNLEVNQTLYNGGLLEYIKLWPLNKPKGKISWSQFNSAVRQLKGQCPWLQCRIRDEFITCPGDEGATLF